MITVNDIKEIVHKLHLDELYESMKECHNDKRGAFLIPTSSKVEDTDYSKYRHLPINWSIAPVTKECLPDEFSPQAVKTVDMFRRKTVDLSYECMIYFDYTTGEIVSCNFSDELTLNRVQSVIYPHLLRNMDIASIHNHPVSYGAPPSGKNFEMLGLKFEDFELISSKKELWILESREKVFSDEEIADLRRNVEEFYDLVAADIHLEFGEDYTVMDTFNKRYGNLLLNYLNDNLDNIKLTRRYLDE